jgi:hypothetical protein
MQRLTLAALGMALAASAAPAQVMGQINQDAPTVSSSIKFKDGGELSLSYTAIHFGEGQWQERMKASPDRLNSFAPTRPLGKVSTTLDVTSAGKTIPAGEYAMFFTIHQPSGSWVLNLKPAGDEDAEPIRWGLRLTESGQQRKRLYIGLTAADKADEALITVAFGDQTVSVPVKPGAAAAEAKEAAADGAKSGAAAEAGKQGAK